MRLKSQKLSDCSDLMKLDVDIKVPNDFLEVWARTRRVIVEYIGYHIVDINVYESHRGYHVFIKFNECVPYDDYVLLQFILGDDVHRVYFTLQRKGFIKYRWNFNILFTDKLKIVKDDKGKVIQVKPYYSR